MKSGIPASEFLPILLVLIVCSGICSKWVNNWDSPASFECKNGQYIIAIASEHSNSKEDRRWEFVCAGSGATDGCMWTGFQNQFDEPFAFLCPDDSVMTGMYSYHDNSKEDRRFDFKCCAIPGKKPYRCYVEPWANFLDEPMTYVVQHYQIIKGGFSYHDNRLEDRRWRFVACSI